MFGYATAIRSVTQVNIPSHQILGNVCLPSNVKVFFDIAV
jgi:hypothetical protein